MRQPEIWRKKSEYEREQEKDNSVLPEQKRHHKAEKGGHAQSRAQENVGMVGLAIAGKHETAHNLTVRFGREEPAEGGERYRDGVGAYGGAPHRRGGSHAADLARNFLEQGTLCRRASQQQHKAQGQHHEQAQSENDGKCHGLDLYIDNLADGENAQDHH